MFRAIRKLYRPEIYQGPRGSANYFEGWYFKLVGEGRAFSLIPGVSRASSDPHSFVQFIDGRAGRSSYRRFHIDEFDYGRNDFWVSVGESRFSLEGISVSLADVHARLEFGEPTLWTGTLFQPGTMGWYAFVPFMECKHAIVVMDARASGEVDGEPWTGRLYLEKDYGRSFPNAWIWLQSNSFAESGVSVTASIANVPFVGGAFTGFLAGIAVEGTLYKFTTYLGSSIRRIEAGERDVELVIDRPDGIELTIRAVREAGCELRSPQDGAMRGRIVETLASRVEVELVERGTRIYSGVGESAGLEVVNPDRLLPPRRR